MILDRLDRYVLRRFAGFYALSLLHLVGLYLVVDLVANLGDFLGARGAIQASGRTVAGAVLDYYAAGLPLVVLQVAPFVTVLGACMTVVDLQRWNELVPMLGAGRSVARVLAPILVFAAVATVVLVLAQEEVAPRAAARRLAILRSLEGREERVLDRLPHVRDARGNAWAVGRYDPHTLTAEWVRAVPFRDGTREYDLIEVPRMRWGRGADGRGGWIPEGGTLLAATDGPDGAAAAIPVAADAPLPTDLTPAALELAAASEDLATRTAAQLRELRDRSPGLRYLTVLLHRRITFPLANLILVLVGVPFVLRSRGSSLFLSVLAALGVCAAYFASDTIACDMGARGILNPALATWLATVLFGALGVALLDRAREA